MTPTLNDGDLVWATGLVEPIDGDIVIAQTEHGEVIKRLRVLDQDLVQLIGDNHAAHHMVAAIDQSAIIGKVIWPPR
jgi:phage repressor protein C with HTH and peptisase S24 domain